MSGYEPFGPNRTSIEGIVKNMENHVFGFFMKNIVFYIYLGIVKGTVCQMFKI